MKWFRNQKRRAVILSASLLLMASAGAKASYSHWSSLGVFLGGKDGVHGWLENAESGSGVEKALYRLMKLPGGDVLFHRSPRETRPELASLIQSNKTPALYSLKALEEEQALDFDAAEQDWKLWVQHAEDKVAANLDLADFYERRLRPQEEVAVLQEVGRSPIDQREKWTAVEDQRAWKAWERCLKLVAQDALGREASARVYLGWEQRYPQESSVYSRELDFLVGGKDFAGAEQLIDRYRKALPGDKVFPVQAQATVASSRGSTQDGIAVYDSSFEPLWPAQLVSAYYQLLEKNHFVKKTTDELRSKLASDPNDLKDAARLFYLYQQQGQIEAAKAVLDQYRRRKDARTLSWTGEELYTLAKLMESIQSLPEAARYYYALSADRQSPDNEEKGAAGLVRILLNAPEQPLRLGAGNLSLYQNIATMDHGPGYLNGVLSLLFNSQSPRGAFSDQSQLAIPYFHRAKASELLQVLDKKFPSSPELPQLHSLLLGAYGVYGENNAVIREGSYYLSRFQNDEGRVAVALQVADAYSRTNQLDKEFALYQQLLKELALQAEGVPLGSDSKAYSKPIKREANSSAASEQSAEQSSTSQPKAAARSAEYAQVLDRYLSRLVTLHRLPEALTVLRGELDRNPQDPGLYIRLAEFFEQNAMNARQEEVYQRAIQQFQDQDWYAKLARFYLRQKRSADYSALTHKVIGIFSGTELETYLAKAPAPDRRLATEVNLYAHQRFPHDLTFVRNLLRDYARTKQDDAYEKLLWEHWSEAPDLRNSLFELLSRTGRLEAQLQVLKQQAPEIEKADWSSLAKSNPAAERFWMDAALWQSHFEQGIDAADALAAEYPADFSLGRETSSLHRSLAYFHQEDTDKAVAIEKRLLSSRPADLEILARIGDIYADHERFSEAVPYWTRMAQAHPGVADGYLQAATVFWDYFDFSSSLDVLRNARQKLGDPALFSYQVGAIEESRGNVDAAIREYVAGALAKNPSQESRSRLLTLAGRQGTTAKVEAATVGLLRDAAPSPNAIDLRLRVLVAAHRKIEISGELKGAIAQTESIDVLGSLSDSARSYALPEVEQQALQRQIALTSDPVRKLQLRYQLVNLLQSQNPSAARAEVDSIYRENRKILGVVRATADYNWEHEQKPQAVAVLLEAAQSAYPDLKAQMQFEAAQKLTELGDHAKAKAILEVLLSQKPLDASYQSAMADALVRSNDGAAVDAFYQKTLEALKAAPLNKDEKLYRIATIRRGMLAAFQSRKDWNAATDQYIELINSYPADKDLLQEAMLFSLEHGTKDKTLEFYRKTVEASPKDPRWSIVLARLQTAAEDLPSAIDAYGKALQLRPEHRDLYEARADLEARLHRFEEAIADYQKLYQLTYRDPSWMEKIAEARARQGKTAEVVKALETAWIVGRPVKAKNSFTVAERLEGWGLLPEAQKYAEQGVAQAGDDLLVDPETQHGAEVYARVMARLRQAGALYARLAQAKQEAGKVTLAAIAQQVVKDGLGAVTDEEWKKQRIAERNAQARSAFASSLQAVARVVATYYTPEEKEQFAQLLDSKRAGMDRGDIVSVILPVTQSAGLTELQAKIHWDLLTQSEHFSMEELSGWSSLEASRGRGESAAVRLEQAMASVPVKQRKQVWQKIAELYRDSGNEQAELRALDHVAVNNGLSPDQQANYYRGLLLYRPQALLQKSGEEGVAQFIVEHGSFAQASNVIALRAANMPPVWRKAYSALTGYYLREHQPEVKTNFAEILAGDASIGERIAHPADRTQQLAGPVWFYYASRYGEYLDDEKDERAFDYLEAALEDKPESAAVYRDLGDHLIAAGRAEAALIDYRNSLELKPDQPAVWDSIAALEKKAGHHAESVDAWQQAAKYLSLEIDAARVPESFWPDFSQVLGSAADNGQFSVIRSQIDSLLRIYLGRNGTYRSESLLEAAYKANGNSVDWLMQITTAAEDQSSVLGSVHDSRWIQKGQRSQISRRVLSLQKSKSAEEADTYSLTYWRDALITDLLLEGNIKEAHAMLSQIPEAERLSGNGLRAELSVADQEGSLPVLLARWRNPESKAPAASEVRGVAIALSPEGRRLVMRYVYERALQARELTAANFLGLADICLEERDVPGAVALLKRLMLVSENLYSDMDSAAAVLEKHGQSAEATPFLRSLVETSPWESSYKVRLARALSPAQKGSPEAVKLLSSVAADSKAKYVDRAEAARSLKGSGIFNLGSGELASLASTSCPTPLEVTKSYFVISRVAAASCASDAGRKMQLLQDALAIAPSDQTLRLKYVDAALAAGNDKKAFALGESLISRVSYYEDDSDESAVGEQHSTAFKLSEEQQAKLLALAIRVYEKRSDIQSALRLIQTRTFYVKDPAQKQFLQKERDRLRLALALERENASRAPQVQTQLEQSKDVRPKLLPGMKFVPKRTEEDEVGEE